MHAIRQYEFGAAGTLRYEDVPDPRPDAGQVRIAVRAAGVHLIDTTIRSGVPAGPYPLPDLPMTPGREVAGVVDAVGSGVDPDWIGRRVVAHLGPASGGYAELAVVAADRTHVIPDHVAPEVAVAMIGTGRTATAILDASPRLGPDHAVLITAAAGGLGGLLMQSALASGAFVVGLAGGPDKVALVRDLGAQAAIDYRADDWTGRVAAALSGRPLTVVLDGVGGDAGRAAFEMLAAGGWLTMFGWSSGEPMPLSAGDLFSRGVTVTSAVGVRIMQAPGGMRGFESRALEAAASGDWKPMLTRFPLKGAAAAHTALETRATVGKTVLLP